MKIKFLYNLYHGLCYAMLVKNSRVSTILYHRIITFIYYIYQYSKKKNKLRLCFILIGSELKQLSAIMKVHHVYNTRKSLKY
jgi:hypothetical protein